MAKTPALTGNIIHSVAVRYQLRGDGELRTTLNNMGEVSDGSFRSVNLNNIDMTIRKNREKTILANFQDQGIQISFRTIFMDEVFKITKITNFIKPVAEGYPVKDGG